MIDYEPEELAPTILTVMDFVDSRPYDPAAAIERERLSQIAMDHPRLVREIYTRRQARQGTSAVGGGATP